MGQSYRMASSTCIPSSDVTTTCTFAGVRQPHLHWSVRSVASVTGCSLSGLGYALRLFSVRRIAALCIEGSAASQVFVRPLKPSLPRGYVVDLDQTRVFLLRSLEASSLRRGAPRSAVKLLVRSSLTISRSAGQWGVAGQPVAQGGEATRASRPGHPHLSGGKSAPTCAGLRQLSRSPDETVLANVYGRLHDVDGSVSPAVSQAFEVARGKRAYRGGGGFGMVARGDGVGAGAKGTGL